MPEGGARLLNRNQKAVARQLSLAAYLLASDGWAKNEVPPTGFSLRVARWMEERPELDLPGEREEVPEE